MSKMLRGRWNNTLILLCVFFIVGFYLHFNGNLGELSNFFNTVVEGKPGTTTTNPYKAPEPYSVASDVRVVSDARTNEQLENEVPDAEEEVIVDQNQSALERALNQRDFALPAIRKNDQIVRRVGYTLRYQEPHEQSDWVAYQLTDKMVAGNQKRENVFMPDPVVKTGTAVTADYTRSGYDRGHLAPAADFRGNFQLMKETFYMSNISPQDRAFNAGKWNDLEKMVRVWATRYKKIYVVTGPVLEPDLPKIGRVNKVSVPRYFYKIVLYAKPPYVKGIAFLMPNENTTRPLSDFVVPIDKVEQLTGIDFFPALPDDIEKKVEAQSNAKDWPRFN